jgi:serine/threonine protein phosphatase 1
MLGLFRKQSRQSVQARPRVELGDPDVIYAIGDIHGCNRQLQVLLDKIRLDAAQFSGRKLIVTLGDHIDRGPQSAAVMDWLSAPFRGDIERVCLAGNHETMMLEFLADPDLDSIWLRNGGQETLMSYGIDLPAFERARQRDRRALLDFVIPSDHVELLRNLPVMATSTRAVFVHAGIRPGVPLNQQGDDDLLWIRQPFLDAAFAEGPLLVHGHTPAEAPSVAGRRICVDTGAYATGTLTALRLTRDGFDFLQATLQDVTTR